MADKKPAKKDDKENRKGPPTKTRLIQDFRPYSKSQQIGKQPKGGRR